MNMPKKGEKKESAPREPVLIIPLKKDDYPRIEVFVDSHGSSILVRDEPEATPRNTRYGGIKPETIMPIVDKLVLIEKMTKDRKKDYDASFESYLKMYKEHKKFMEGLL